MTTIARLYKDAELHLLNELNERLPKLTNGLIVNFPMDGSLNYEAPNLFIKNTQVDGFPSEGTGVIASPINQDFASDFISISPNTIYTLKTLGNGTKQNTPVISWYDNNKKYISRDMIKVYSDAILTRTSPGNAYYAIVSSRWKDIVTLKFEQYNLLDIQNNINKSNCILTDNGIYVEEGTTNLITDLSGIHGYPSDTVGILQPDGFFKFNVSSDNNEILQSSNRIVKASTTYTESFLFKTDSTNVVDGIFNISFFTNKHNEVPVIIQKLGYNLYKASASYTTLSTETTIRALDIIRINNLNGTYISIRDAQLEEKPYATSYISGTRPNSNNGVQIPTSYFQFPFSVTMEVIPDIKDGSNSVYGIAPQVMFIATLWKPKSVGNYWGTDLQIQRNQIINDLISGFKYTMIFRANGYDVYINSNKIKSNVGYFSGAFNLSDIPMFTIGGRGYESGYAYGNALYKNIAFYNRELSQDDVNKLCNSKLSLSKYGNINGLELIERINLILNGNFDKGVIPGSSTAPTNWTFFGSGTRVFSNQGETNYNTLGVLYIGHNTVDTGVKQDLKLKENTLYTIKFRLGNENVNNVYCNITYYNSSNNILSTTSFNYNFANHDVIQSFVFTTPTNFDHCTFIHGGIAVEYGNGFLTRLGNVELLEGNITKMQLNQNELYVNELVEGSDL